VLQNQGGKHGETPVQAPTSAEKLARYEREDEDGQKKLHFPAVAVVV
jgi:hypothetical protein